MGWLTMAPEVLVGSFILFLSLFLGVVTQVELFEAKQCDNHKEFVIALKYWVLALIAALGSGVLGYYGIDTIRLSTSCSPWWYLTTPLPGLVGMALLRQSVSQKK
jgi:hypothetical protein